MKQVTPFPPDGASVERRNPVGRHAGTPEPVQGYSAGEARASVEALAALLEPEAFDPNQLAAPEWRARTQDVAIGHAAKVITSGYRRVVEDDDTIERLAEAARSREAVRFAENEKRRGGNAWLTPWSQLPENTREWYRLRVADVVRALREDT